MKQLTFAELAQMLQKATGKTQQATVDTLFDWAFKKKGTSQSGISPSLSQW